MKTSILILLTIYPVLLSAVEVTFESFQTGTFGNYEILLVIQEESKIVAYSQFNDGLADDITRRLVSEPIDISIPALLATDSIPIEFITIEDVEEFADGHRILFSTHFGSLPSIKQPYDYSLATTWVYAYPFGWVFPVESDWYYSTDLKWFYVLDAGLIDSVNTYWFYVQELDEWVYTSDTLYPWAAFSQFSYRILPLEVKSQPGG